MMSPHRSAYMAILEFANSVPFPIPAETLGEAEDLAVSAALELPGLTRVPVYVWGGPENEYILLQVLEAGRRT
jgi:hypothetical protein